jgi:hypothetical protein
MTPRPIVLALAIVSLSAGPVASRPEDQLLTRPVPLSETPVYTDGSVWVLEYVRVKEGATERYLERLADDWRMVLDPAHAEGLILSYKVWLGLPSDHRDWDVMTAVEVRNMGMLDGLSLRLGTIAASPAILKRKPAGTIVALSELREVVGQRLVREAVLRPPR